MNILITTLSLLLVLGASLKYFWKEEQSLEELLFSAQSYLSTSLQLENIAEKETFKKLGKEKPSPHDNKQTSHSSQKKTKVFLSHRQITPPLEAGKVRAALLRDKEHESALRPLCRHLCEELYGHTSWYNREKIDAILTFFIEKKNLTDKQSFIEAIDDDLYDTLYHLLKGTQVYNIEKKIGYPPIQDFVDFSLNPGKRFCSFPFLPAITLKVLFGKTLTEMVLEKEKTKWESSHKQRYCTKKELLPLTAYEKNSLELTHFIETYCSFQNSSGKRPFIEACDSKKGVSLRQNHTSLY